MSDCPPNCPFIWLKESKGIAPYFSPPDLWSGIPEEVVDRVLRRTTAYLCLLSISYKFYVLCRGQLPTGEDRWVLSPQELDAPALLGRGGKIVVLAFVCADFVSLLEEWILRV